MVKVVVTRMAWLLSEPFKFGDKPRTREQRLVAAMQHFDMLTAREVALARWEQEAGRRQRVANLLGRLSNWAQRLGMYRLSEWFWRKAMKVKGWDKVECITLK